MSFLKIYPLFTLFIFFSLTGCQHYGLDVRKIYLNKSSLASTFAHTPDPRQTRPPMGQQLFIRWNYENPITLEEGSLLTLRVIYKDFHEEEFIYPILLSKGDVSFFHMKMEEKSYSPILTYQSELKDAKGVVIDTVTHKLWFKLIPFEKDF